MSRSLYGVVCPLARAGFGFEFGFVLLELQMAGFYTETDEVFVGELDVIVTFSDRVWLRSGDCFCFFGCC